MLAALSISHQFIRLIVLVVVLSLIIFVARCKFHTAHIITSQVVVLKRGGRLLIISNNTFIIVEISIARMWTSITKSILKQVAYRLYFLSRTEVLSCLKQACFVRVGIIRLVSVICSGCIFWISLRLLVA